MARNDTNNIFKNYPDALTLGEFAEMLAFLISSNWLFPRTVSLKLLMDPIRFTSKTPG